MNDNDTKLQEAESQNIPTISDVNASAIDVVTSDENKTDAMVSKIINNQVDTIRQKTYEGSMTLKDASNEVVTAVATADILQDRAFRKDRAKLERDKHLAKGTAEVKQAEGDVLQAKQEKAEKFYKNFRPILEFDFSNLTHKESTNTKTYNDRSYGIPLMVLMIAILVAPYVLFSIVLALLNGINALFENLKTFTKSASIICGILLIIAIAGIATYCGIRALEGILDIKILPQHQEEVIEDPNPSETPEPEPEPEPEPSLQTSSWRINDDYIITML